MQTSKALKRILLPLLVGIIFIAGVVGMKYCFSGETITDAFNYHIAQIEKNDEPVELLFIGGSRTYRSYDPKYFEKELGLENAVNLGSPAQRSQLGYYLLCDTLEKHQPEYVVFGFTYNGMLYEQNPHTALYGIDRMSLVNKFRSAISIFGFNKGILTVTGKSEYAGNMSLSRILDNIKSKIEYAHGAAEAEKGDGYLGEEGGKSNGNISFNYDESVKEFSTDDMLDVSIEYLEKSVELCKNKGIKVFFASAPCSLMNTYRVKGYQSAVDYYTDYAEKNGFKYFNLNYLKNREELFPDDAFKDYVHLNKKGGQTVSRIFAKILKEELEGKDTSKYFYKNLDEMKADIHRIPGCGAKIEESGNELVVKVASYHNDGVTPEYRISYSDDGENYEPLTKWKTMEQYTFDKKELLQHSMIKVEARTGEPGEVIAYKVLELKKFQN